MFNRANSQIERRINSLEQHLRQENPVLLKVVQSFRDLDWVAYRMGLLKPEESFATRVPWWPLISILGTFSSGKSTFINSHLGIPLQRTGNQAVDDKFTVICFSNEDQVHTLPGLALDADPRFPFYQISNEIERVVSGEGRRIDAYLQLKTCPSEQLRGKIMIDSPGFDADAQRTSTLRITDHIMDLSDLVLVFFDARHPEPGAMRDTLDHLVANTINRHDSNKFLFILNQIDCTVREDNLEDVVAAWQRALAQSGLTAGRFYQIYNKGASMPIDDEQQRQRYESKLEEDISDLMERIHRVEIERAYRIIGVLEHTANLIRDEVVPKVSAMMREWRRGVLLFDGILLAVLAVLALVWNISSANPWSWIGAMLALPWQSTEGWGWSHAGAIAVAAAALSLLSYSHFLGRRLVAKMVLRRNEKKNLHSDLTEFLRKAFTKNSSSLHSIFGNTPAGWGRRANARINWILKETDAYVQNMNDQFTNPSGNPGGKNPSVIEVN
ncbi:MAG: dynamin family protein [Magnetococcales bacterium]|nr:dynamin family protein [Magnetococcales bacterium]